jgi:hypothetical protein
MIVCRPYIQTRVTNFVAGIVIPVSGSAYLARIVLDPHFEHKIYYFLSLPFFVLGGFYFLFFGCVWHLHCDDEKKTLTFFKTLRKKTFSIRHIDRLTVFKTIRGFDYRFEVAQHSFTLEEMDNMPELIAYLKKTKPQLDINSPEDKKYF